MITKSEALKRARAMVSGLTRWGENDYRFLTNDDGNGWRESRSRGFFSAHAARGEMIRDIMADVIREAGGLKPAPVIFEYVGDVNISNGGYFVSFANWGNGYIDCFRVVPVSDAGGPDNVFWLEEISIPAGLSDDEIRPALECCGIDPAFWNAANAATKRRIYADCLLSYGRYDIHQSTIVQIGPADPFYGGRERFNVDYFLRASVSLRKLARKMAGGFSLSACVKPLER